MKQQHEIGGFALVLTLVLLALMVGVVFGISALTRTDADFASTAQFRSLARQNAFLAMSLALDQLQKAAGPSNRQTGMAGMVGVPNGSQFRHWTGIWGDPDSPVWLTSGAANGSASPNLAGTRVVLVGPGSVGNPQERTDQELVEAGLLPVNVGSGVVGNYAFWTGDEGVKISSVVPDMYATTSAETGNLLRPDTKRLVSSKFDPSNPVLVRLVAFDQLPLTASGVSLTGSFHSLTLTHYALPSTCPGGATDGHGYVEGAFNVNTTSAPAWRALLEYPDRLQKAYAISDDSALANSRKISDRLTAFGSHFSSVQEFIDSGIVQEAFNSTPNKITKPTAADFLKDVAPILATRSDTFRIRAYGDAVNPVDAENSDAVTQAIAYCEAIVQRTNQDDPGGHGKKFVIIYFRWLGPDDI